MNQPKYIHHMRKDTCKVFHPFPNQSDMQHVAFVSMKIFKTTNLSTDVFFCINIAHFPQATECCIIIVIIIIIIIIIIMMHCFIASSQIMESAGERYISDRYMFSTYLISVRIYNSKKGTRCAPTIVIKGDFLTLLSMA